MFDHDRPDADERDSEDDDLPVVPLANGGVWTPGRIQG